MKFEPNSRGLSGLECASSQQGSNKIRPAPPNLAAPRKTDPVSLPKAPNCNRKSPLVLVDDVLVDVVVAVVSLSVSLRDDYSLLSRTCSCLSARLQLDFLKMEKQHGNGRADPSTQLVVALYVRGR